MNKNLLTAPLLGAALVSGFAQGQDKAQKPNVIYILMDDMGYAELGCYGQKLIETPNIDAIAEHGVRLTQAYAGSSISAPTRCTTMTGKHTGHAPIRNNHLVPNSGGQRPMPADTKTIAHIMQDAGYATGCFGKWGLGYPGSVSTPNKMGFDTYCGFICQSVAHNHYPTYLYKNDDKIALNNPDSIKGSARLPKEDDPYAVESYAKYQGNEYSHDVMFNELTQFVDSNKEKPFFIYWSTPIPHVSLQAPQKWIDYYQKKFDEKEPYLGTKGYLPARYPRATYAAMISYFDDQVGQVVEQLKKEGIYDNTLIIFTSDNGPTFNGGSDSPFFDSAAPFISKGGRIKCAFYEGGIRVPLVASWPGHITPGTTSDHICAAYDMMATVAEAAGASASVPADTDGISYLPALVGKEQAKHDYIYFELGNKKAVRMGKWKAIASTGKTGTAKVELYNLDEDIQEQNDLAGANPEIVAQIVKIMDESHTEPPTFESPFDTKEPKEKKAKEPKAKKVKKA